MDMKSGMLYRLLIAADLVIAGVVASYLFEGLALGWISSFNMHIWIIATLFVLATLSGGYMLRAAGRTWLANAVLALLAFPGAVYALFLGAVVPSGTPWN